MTTETPTNPIDDIQRLLLSVIGGQDPAEVKSLVESQLTIVARELDQVPERARQRGDDFTQQISSCLEALLEQLRKYQAWLQELDESLQEHDTGGIMQAYEESQTLAPALVEAQGEYVKFFAGHGPHQSQWSNALEQAAQAVRRSEMSKQGWQEHVAHYQRQFRAAREHAQTVKMPGRAILAENYATAVEALDILASADPTQPAALEEAFKGLDQSVIEAEKMDKLVAEASASPTPIPATNVLLTIVRKAMAGELEMQIAESVFDDYCEISDSFWEGFEQSIQRPMDSALVQDEIPRTIECADAQYVALEALSEALPKRDVQAVNEALQQLEQVANRLNESREVYATAAQHQSHTMCPACGRANPPENRVCEACGQTLQRMEEGLGITSSTFSMMTGPALEENQQMVMTENVAKLFDACDNVAVGKITPEEFAEVLAWAAKGLKEYADEIEQIAIDVSDESDMSEEVRQVWREQHLPYLHEVSASFEQGVAEVEEGLSFMANYLNEPDDQHLIDGVRGVWEGMGTLHRAQLSLETSAKTLADLLEEAAEQGLLTEEG
ncbi:MAG: zinc ribbon domain-containing protein [Candidatus Eremiobacteraeota bacterium]|nr:zinc ribbon domain-containing protein [Candidatus Eremiobacteraeota bacterium]